MYGDTKNSKEPKQSCKRKMELEESGSQISDYSDYKAQSSKQCGTGTKIQIQINGKGLKIQK